MEEFYTKDIKQLHSKIIFQKSGMYCWETPNSLFEELNKEFCFTLDVCANEENHKTDIYFSEENDGLKQEWETIKFNEVIYNGI